MRGSGGFGGEDYVDQRLYVWEVAVQVFLFHPVVVKIGVARLGDAEGGADEGVFELVCQLEYGMATLGVLPMRHLVAGAVGFEGLAGGAPELLGTLDQGSVGDLPLGVVQELEGQAGVLVGLGFGGGHGYPWRF